ncbi:MAG: arsenate reductase ArsC [Actinobacteria bacterium]|nr:arsenate reductase ArsC [Actinomycetota bacterium]MBW3646981.1 arsenate reductase ArsC [Actinomycetota bacterium]
MTAYDSAAPDAIPQRLRPVVDRLTERFSGTFAPETVCRLVVDSYEQLVAAAAIDTYLPLLTQHFAADRLCATAAVEGKIEKDRPEVLFVCVHNAGRSQMAAALLEHRSGGRILVRSAGSAPTSDVNPVATTVMAEIGLDLSSAYPKPLTTEAVQASDVVITMGCGDACPVFPGKRYLDWQLDDPAGQPLEVVRRIRDDIDARVQALVAELLPAATKAASDG